MVKTISNKIDNKIIIYLDTLSSIACETCKKWFNGSLQQATEAGHKKGNRIFVDASIKNKTIILIRFMI